MYTANEVSYVIHDKKKSLPIGLLQPYTDFITKENKQRVWRKFPFAQGAPHWVIALLLEGNNISRLEKIINFYNHGGEIMKTKYGNSEI